MNPEGVYFNFARDLMLFILQRMINKLLLLLIHCNAVIMWSVGSKPADSVISD